MDEAITNYSPEVSYEDRTGLFQGSKKNTVIRLRWLIVIVTSYLLVYSKSTWLPTETIYLLIFLFLLSNTVLYFVYEELFESTYFYGPLVVFDTLFVTACLVISGQVGTDFYLLYFLIVILSTIWQDFRGIILVSVLATLLYGYFLLMTTSVHDPSVYLRIPFLFIMSLFYGHFAEVVRIEKSLKEKAEQEAQDMAMIQTLSQSLPSSLDYQQIIGTLGERISSVVPADGFYVFIKNEAGGSSHGLLFAGTNGERSMPTEVDLHEYSGVQECLRTLQPVIQNKVSPVYLSDEGREDPSSFSYPLTLAVPITFRREALGAILLGFNIPDRALTSRQVQFCQIVAFSTAIALSNAKKYEDLQMEARRRQVIAEELAEANRLKLEYLANTSHELRTPIATIIGYGNLLMDGACGQLVEQQKKVIERLSENARGLLVLVDQILDYSKFEKGDKGLYIKRGTVEIFVDQLRRVLTPLEGTRPANVQYDVQNNISPIKTDWGKLRSVISNLLSNALKFTEEGEVKLSIMNGAGGKEVSFIVSDTGIGISEEQLPMIFNKFHQVDGSTSKRYSGTGLGLTVTKNLVDLLRGRIGVESKLGKGSTFTVTIPVSIS